MYIHRKEVLKWFGIWTFHTSSVFKEVFLKCPSFWNKNVLYEHSLPLKGGDLTCDLTRLHFQTFEQTSLNRWIPFLFKIQGWSCAICYVYGHNCKQAAKWYRCSAAAGTNPATGYLPYYWVAIFVIAWLGKHDKSIMSINLKSYSMRSIYFRSTLW